MPAAGTIPRFAWQCVIDSTNRAIRVTCDGVTETVQLALGTYYWLGDDSAADLCKALDTALTSHSKHPTITVYLDPDGTIRIVSSLALTIKAGDALTTIDPAWLGMTATDYAASGSPLTITSPNQVGHLWNPERRYSDDTGLRCLADVSQVWAAGQPDTWVWNEWTDRSILFRLVPYAKVLTADSATNEGFDLFYRWLYSGGSFYWTPDITAPSTHALYVISDPQWLRSWPVEQGAGGPRYYQIRIPMRPVTWS